VTTKQRTIVTILAAALALRVGWAVVGTAVVEEEGSYYARLGENIAAGHGYIGVRANGEQLLYPPLYPLAIAGLARLGLRAVTAGRTLSVIAGALLVLPVLGLARRLYGDRAAALAGWLVACFPLLVTISATVLTEPFYTTLIAAGVYYTVRWRDDGRPGTAALAGAMFGLAYLLRQEALLVFGAVLGFVWFFARSPRSLRLRHYAVATVVFGVFALPYIAFLWRETGELRFEAKSSVTLLVGQEMRSGVPDARIYFEVDSNLVPHGVNMLSDLDVIHHTAMPTSARLGLMVWAAHRNLPKTVESLAGGQPLGEPLLLTLVVLGLFRSSWRAERAPIECLVLVVVGVTIVVECTVVWFYERFLTATIPFLLLWAAHGLEEVHAWARDTVSRWPAQRARRFAVALPALVCLALFGDALVGVRHVGELTEGWHGSPGVVSEKVGLWLRGLSPAPTRIGDTDVISAFYAGATLTPLPESTGTTALRYLDDQSVDCLIIRSAARGWHPYLRTWVDSGIPSPRAILLRRVPDGASGTIAIYRWGHH